MARRKSNKPSSDLYQYRILEIGLDHFKLGNFSTEDSIGAKLEEVEEDQRIIDLRKELFKEIAILIDTKLTEHQKKVMSLLLQDKTQAEIGDILNCSQSAVHKALWGNIDYKSGGLRYGGIVHKLTKLSIKHEPIQIILKQIKSIKDEDRD